MTDMKFLKYQHVERLGASATEGITDGICYVFPKLDGTNGQLWWDGNYVCGGSRNRTLDIHNDNAGFLNACITDGRYSELFLKHPTIRLYGEWLVPHSLKTYRDDAWRRFYVFDVADDSGLLHFDVYEPLLKQYNIDYIPPIAIIKNPTPDNLLQLLEKSGMYLVQDGMGKGEGIVVKNYDYTNKYGVQTWAKMVTNEFKEKHHKEMGAPLINGTLLVEERIVTDFCTEDFIRKEQAKIINERGEWTSRMIPELLGKVWYNFINEEAYNFTKKYKNPTVHFGTLQGMIIRKVKTTIGI